MLANHKSGAIHFPGRQREQPTLWSLTTAGSADPQSLDGLLFGEWQLPQPAAVFSVEGADVDAELTELPPHEQLELAHGLSGAARAARAWVITSGTCAGAADVACRALLAGEAPDVISLGVAPWPSTVWQVPFPLHDQRNLR